MNIAICFFGQVKNYNHILHYSFKKHVLKTLPIGLIDYFLVTYNNSHIFNPRNNEDNDIDYRSIFQYFNWQEKIIVDIESSSVKEIDNFATNLVSRYGGGWNEPENDMLSTKFAIRQIYGLKLLYENIEKKYDYYVFLRPDVLFVKTLVCEFSKNLEILVPSFASWGGYNDRFALIGSQNALRAYCKRYDYIFENPEIYHSEKYLKKTLLNNKIIVAKNSSIYFNRIRANTVLKSIILP